MNRNYILSLIIFIVYCYNPLSASLYPESGKPFITNYGANQYHGYFANWAIVQNHQGIMYFGNGNDNGNGHGILEYDGISWNLIPIPNRSTVRSLAISNQGDDRIYVGAVDDFGYLEPDSTGQLRYVSLLEFVDEQDRNFGDVWETHFTKHGVYFVTHTRLFCWSNDQIKVWRPKTRFHLSAVIRDTLYVRQWEVGIMRLENDSLQLVPDGEKFAHERIYVILPYDHKKILFGTRTQGLFLYDGNSFKPFKTEIDDFLKQNEIYLPGCVLNNGNFALGTMRGGLVIIDRKGRLVQYINKDMGLQDNTIFYIYQDQQGNLWLALNKGISKIEISSPFTFYNETSGIEATVYYVTKHNGIVYVATSLGVYYLDPQEKRFRIIPGITSESWHMLSFNDHFLVATFNGVYEIANETAKLIRKSVSYDYRALTMARSKLNKNRIYVGLENGLASLRLHENRWIDEGKIATIHEQIHSIAETQDGRIWLGTNTSGLLCISSDADLSSPFLNIKRYGIENGLPSGGVSVFSIGNRVYFGTNAGLYRLNKNNNSFILDSTFASISNSGSSGNYTLREDVHGDIWINFGSESAVARYQPNGSYVLEKTPFLRFAHMPIYDIYPEANGVVWFGGSDGLIRYDSKIQKDYSADFPVLIRQVIVDEDSIIFSSNLAKHSNHSIPELKFSSNSIRFGFAAPNFEAESETKFQTFLEGFDKNWSSWKNEAKKDYTNLPEGEYRFIVRAKNVYAHISNGAAYEFEILPPWYRTWYSYMTYGLLLVIALFTTDRIQRRRLIHREREKSRLREIELRAEAAEARSKALQSENQRKKNVELLSRIGQVITANLSIENIIDTVYENVNTLMDATLLGIGIYNEDEQRIDFPAAKEKGKTLPLFSHYLYDQNRPSVWCFKNQEVIFSNDYANDYKKYVGQLENTAAGSHSASVLYVPLIHNDKPIGVITAQSFQKNSYTEYHLNILRNLATYVAIALDNAEAYRRLNKTIDDLQTTQQKLVIQEKLASLGALTAGIAHEIKNPLNFVNNFAELTVELVEELKEHFIKHKDKLSSEEEQDVEEIFRHLDQNAKKINEHGKRADSIVRGMLQHSRGKAGERQLSNINDILDEDLNLAYHGMRAQNSEFNITIEKYFDPTIGELEIIPQEISRVFLNIISNGLYETHKKRKQNGENYTPSLAVFSKNLKKYVEVRIRDNGNGIPEFVRDKLFEPFFTTKPAGQGTGLGLSLSHDIIVKSHNGEITFETEEGKFTEFIIKLPRMNNGKTNDV